MYINTEHKELKLVITVGVVTSSSLSVMAPAMTMHAVVLGILINILWIWI